LEAFADTLAVNLVGQVGEANITHELFADYGDGGRLAEGSV